MTSSQPSPNYRPDHRTALDALLLPVPGVTTGWVFGHPAYWMNGRMFAGLVQDGVILKLPQETIEALLQQEGVTLFAPMGSPMRGWVSIPVAEPDGYSALQPYVEQAMEYVLTLPAPRSRKRK